MFRISHVAEAGIEPAVEVDEASVLPLHYPAINTAILVVLMELRCKDNTKNFFLLVNNAHFLLSLYFL